MSTGGLEQSEWSPSTVHGDYSRCSQPLINIKTKVAFQSLGLKLKRNFGFNVNGRLGKNINGHPVQYTDY